MEYSTQGAAACIDGHAGDRRGFRGSQKGDHLADLLRVNDPADCVVLGHAPFDLLDGDTLLLSLLSVQGIGPLCAGDARVNQIYRDAVRS